MMLDFVLIALFASAVFAVGLSLADSVVKFCNACHRARLDVAKSNVGLAQVSEGAVVTLPSQVAGSSPRELMPLAAAA